MKKAIFVLLAAFLILGLLAGCSKDEDGKSSDITISGTLSDASETRSSARTVQYELYKLYCVTFTDPPIAASGDADSSGAFELKLEGAKEMPFGCFVQDKDTSSVVATLVFEDTSKQGMGGDNQTSGQISLTGSSSLGTISLDFDKGIATVDMSSIKTIEDTTEVASADLWDFTGTWMMQNADNIPTGYDTMPACGEGVHGPCFDSGSGDGMTIYLKRVEAKDVKSGSPVFGIMVWQSQTAYTACGEKLGFKVSDAKQHAGVDFTETVSAGDISEGTFTWTPSTSCGTFLDDTGWKCSNATAQWDLYITGGVSPDVAKGTQCSSIDDSTDALRRAKLQCFAEAYWQLVDSDDQNVCAQEIRFDWSATNADNFVMNDGPTKAKNQFVFEKFIYSGANSGSFSQRSEWVDGVYDEVSDTYKHCKMVEHLTMNFTKVSDTSALGDMQFVTKLISDASDAACSSDSKISGRLGQMRYSLKFTKK